MRLTDCHEFAIDLDQPGDHGAGFNGLLVAIGPTSELIEVVADPGELSQQGRVDLGTLAPARRLHAADGLPDQRRQCQAGRLRRLAPGGPLGRRRSNLDARHDGLATVATGLSRAGSSRVQRGWKPLASPVGRTSSRRRGVRTRVCWLQPQMQESIRRSKRRTTGGQKRPWTPDRGGPERERSTARSSQANRNR